MLSTSYTKWKTHTMTGYYRWPYSNPSTTAWMPASPRGLVGQTLRSISCQTRLRRANLMPDLESAQKTIETTLLSTFGPETTIVGNVTAPSRQLGYSFPVSLSPKKKKEREKWEYKQNQFKTSFLLLLIQ